MNTRRTLVTSVVSKADKSLARRTYVLAFCVNIWYNTDMENIDVFTVSNSATHGRGYVYSLQYHIVWVTKYRKPIFTGSIEEDVKQYLIHTMESPDMKVMSM